MSNHPETLGHLDFITESPDNLDTPVSSIDLLISQNEDLSARLNNQSRRNAQIESQVYELQKKYSECINRNSLLEEQLLIWKEKEKSWIKRIDENRQASQMLPQIESELSSTKEQMTRYQRYHERIKNQVKPYITQLKAFAQKLQENYKRLEEESHNKDQIIQQLRESIESVKSSVQAAQIQINKYKEELQTAYQRDRAIALEQIEDLQRQNNELTLQANKVEIALFRQNELENLLIDTRSKSEIKLQELRNENKNLKIKLAEVEPLLNDSLHQIQDLKEQLKIKEEVLSRSLHQEEKTLIQLQQMREQWSDKTKTIEQMKLQLKSLEEINRDLATKLNLQRQIDSNSQ